MHQGTHVAALFDLRTQYVTFDTPANLKGIKAEIFRREREKADAQWTDALAECRQLLRATMAELVGHIQERLEPGEDGKPKTFHKSMLEKLDEFLTTFAARNIADDQELGALVKQAKEALVCVDATSLRKNDALRDVVKGQFDDLKAQLGFCQLDQAKASFAPIESGSAVSQQAPVTTSHSMNAHVRSKR